MIDIVALRPIIEPAFNCLQLRVCFPSCHSFPLRNSLSLKEYLNLIPEIGDRKRLQHPKTTRIGSFVKKN